MVELILFYASLLALPLLLGGWPLLAWRHVLRGGVGTSREIRVAVTAGLVVVPIFAAWAIWRVLSRSGSTAPLGLLMVPIYTLLAGVVSGLAAGAAVALVKPSRAGAKTANGLRRVAAAALLVALAWWPAAAARSEVRARRAGTQSAPALEALSECPSARRDPYVMAAVASNPACPPKVLEALAADGRPVYRRRLDGGPRALLVPPPGGGRSVLELVARHPHTPSGSLAHLAADPSSAVRAATAANPATPSEAIRRLGDDGDLSVQVSLASNPSAPPEVLARLAAAESVYTRLRVATNLKTPSPALEALAESPDSLVRREVAANPSTPSGTLARLAGDEDPEVRFRLTTNPSLPDDVLRALTGDADEKVRGYAAEQQRSRGREDDDEGDDDG